MTDKLSQGLWLVGEFDGTSDRTVRPKPDGKQFEPFDTFEIVLVVSDDVRRVSYREGKRPAAFDELPIGSVVAVGVRSGSGPYLDGRSVAPIVLG